MNNYFLLMMVAATVSNAAIVDTVTETAKLHPKKTGALVGSLLIGTPTFTAWRRAERALEKHNRYLKHLVTAPTNEDLERRDALRSAARYARNRCIALTLIGGVLGAGAGKWYEGRRVSSRSGSPIPPVVDPERVVPGTVEHFTVNPTRAMALPEDYFFHADLFSPRESQPNVYKDYDKKVHVYKWVNKPDEAPALELVRAMRASMVASCDFLKGQGVPDMLTNSRVTEDMLAYIDSMIGFNVANDDAYNEVRRALLGYVNAIVLFYPSGQDSKELKKLRLIPYLIPGDYLGEALSTYSGIGDILRETNRLDENSLAALQALVSSLVGNPLLSGDMEIITQNIKNLSNSIDAYKLEIARRQEGEEHQRLLVSTAELEGKGFSEAARIAIAKDVPDAQREGKIALCVLAVDRLTQVAKGLPATASEARARLGGVGIRLLDEGTAEALDNALDEGLKIATPSDELNERARALNSFDTRPRSALTGHINSLRLIEREKEAAKERGEKYDGHKHIKESCFSLADKIVTLEDDLAIWNQGKDFGNKQELVGQYREKYKNLRVTEGKDLARRMLYAVVGAHWPDE